MGFSRQEYWSGLPYPPPGDLPIPGIEPRSPAFQADSLPSEPLGNPSIIKIKWSQGPFPDKKNSFLSLLQLAMTFLEFFKTPFRAAIFWESSQSNFHPLSQLFCTPFLCHSRKLQTVLLTPVPQNPAEKGFGGQISLGSATCYFQTLGVYGAH